MILLMQLLKKMVGWIQAAAGWTDCGCCLLVQKYKLWKKYKFCINESHFSAWLDYGAHPMQNWHLSNKESIIARSPLTKLLHLTSWELEGVRTAVMGEQCEQEGPEHCDVQELRTWEEVVLLPMQTGLGSFCEEIQYHVQRVVHQPRQLSFPVRGRLFVIVTCLMIVLLFTIH